MKLVQRLEVAARAFSNRDLARAERECRAVLSEQPRDPNALHLLGLVRRRAGDLAAAETLLRASVELVPDRAEFRVNYGNLLRAARRFADAEREYRMALDVDPSSRPARLSLARVLNDAGMHSAAETEARRLLDRNDRDAEAWVVLAVAQRAQGCFADAETSYREALLLTPDYGVARHNLGALLGHLKRAEESLAELDRAAALGVSGAKLQFNRGRALLELGRYSEAEAALSSAVRAAPTDPESQILLAKLRFMCGDQDFVRDLETAVATTSDPTLTLALGDLLRRAGRLPAAERILRRMHARYPGSPEVAASLAVLLQEQSQFEEAISLARSAMAARPNDPDISENVIVLLFQVGNAAEAKPLIAAQRLSYPLDQRWLAHEATAARLLREPRYEELYDYARFVRAYDLDAPSGYESIEAFNAALAERLHALHGRGFAAHPLDQSLRLGTQTSRSLLVDPDPGIRAFLQALTGPLEDYRRSIGDDPSHPLTVRNRGATRLAGCWSVRLQRGGYHVNHLHPEGWISSAYYVEVPDEVGDESAMSGWIKFGEPRMPTPGAGPAHFVQPQVGRLVLFPSYMWHGTTPIHGDQPRMTIAFDAVPA